PGTVRAVVVGDQDVHLRHRGTEPAGDESDVLGLVVGRDDHENASDSRVPALSGLLRRRAALAHVSSRTVSGRAAAAARRVRVRPTPAHIRTSTPKPTRRYSGQGPSLVASVRSPLSRCRARMTLAVLKPVACVTVPCPSTNPETPTVEAINADRPCSTARSR